jgi:hypothetical protein
MTHTLTPETAALAMLTSSWQRRFVSDWTRGEVADWRRRFAVEGGSFKVAGCKPAADPAGGCRRASC